MNERGQVTIVILIIGVVVTVAIMSLLFAWANLEVELEAAQATRNYNVLMETRGAAEWNAQMTANAAYPYPYP